MSLLLEQLHHVEVLVEGQCSVMLTLRCGPRPLKLLLQRIQRSLSLLRDLYLLLKLILFFAKVIVLHFE